MFNPKKCLSLNILISNIVKERSFYTILFGICIFIVSCTNKTEKGDNAIAVIDSIVEPTLVTAKGDSIEREKRKVIWNKAREYGESITDTTFLKTKGRMSDAAIDPFNPNYAFNEVVYLKALERAKKYLSLKNNQLIFNLKSGKEIYITEDLYDFISGTFDLWNTLLKEGKFELRKDEKGLYDLYPITK